MAPSKLVMPALRGSFGDWIYYTCLMPIHEVGTRVKYAEEVHPNKALSQLIQRSLEGVRAKHIAEYLTSNKERFFNSLVLATYGGSPEWLEVGNFQSTTKPEVLKLIAKSAMDNLGFLSLGGSEKIFAVDGQHRLAGIKRAISEGLDLDDEQVPVILVGHKNTKAGMQRTRRLFTTLNKTAVPVRKSDIIALDEDDVMAITARRLVETNPWFEDPKIAVISSQNIPAANKTCLTTISNLYDVLKIVFMFDLDQKSDRNLKFNRPSDERLEHSYGVATAYFTALAKAFKPVKELFTADDPSAVTSKYRGGHGGHLLFRPIGLEMFTRVAALLAKKKGIDLPAAVDLMKGIPTDLAEEPFLNVLWDPNRLIIISPGKRLGRDILRYMVGLELDEQALKNEYALSLLKDEAKVKLPPKVL